MPPPSAARCRSATRPLGRQTEACARSHSRRCRAQHDHGAGTPHHCNLTQQTLSGDHHTNAVSDHARLSNPHSADARLRRTLAGPRFPPLRLIGRLPSEPAAPSVRGRHPITLNTSGLLRRRQKRRPRGLPPHRELARQCRLVDGGGARGPHPEPPRRDRCRRPGRDPRRGTALDVGCGIISKGNDARPATRNTQARLTHHPPFPSGFR